MLKYKEVEAMIDIISSNIDGEGTFVCLYAALNEPNEGGKTVPSFINIIGSDRNASVLIGKHMDKDKRFKNIIETAINIDRIIAIEI